MNVIYTCNGEANNRRLLLEKINVGLAERAVGEVGRGIIFVVSEAGVGFNVISTLTILLKQTFGRNRQISIGLMQLEDEELEDNRKTPKVNASATKPAHT